MIGAADPSRDLATLVVPRVGRLIATGDRYEPYRLVDADGAVVAAATAWFRDLLAAGRSEATVRSYGMDLLRWFRFVWSGTEVAWDRATRIEARRAASDARRPPGSRLPQRRRDSTPRPRIPGRPARTRRSLSQRTRQLTASSPTSRPGPARPRLPTPIRARDQQFAAPLWRPPAPGLAPSGPAAESLQPGYGADRPARVLVDDTRQVRADVHGDTEWNQPGSRHQHRKGREQVAPVTQCPAARQRGRQRSTLAQSI